MKLGWTWSLTANCSYLFKFGNIWSIQCYDVHWMYIVTSWATEHYADLFTRKNPRTLPKKIRKIRKNPKNIQKKSKDFFEDLKSVYFIWGCKTARIRCWNPFLFIKSTYTKKKFRKIQKRNPRILKFWGFKIRTPYLGVNSPSISVFKYFFIHKILVHPKKSE